MIKKIILLMVIIILLSPPYATGNDSPLSKAYSLYYSGKVKEAIQMMEDYVAEHPDPGAYYFLGYAYYELEDLEKAREYFDEAYRLSSFYSPMEKK
jgi:TolA-binding protein